MQPLYNDIGKTYDTTRRADPSITRQLYSMLAPTDSGSYLDLACGTGNYTIALQQLGLKIVGVDHSALMIEAARKKAPDLKWQVADASKFLLPSFVRRG